MSGVFGVASRDDCVSDLFYGTDYHSHLGTRRGGLATLDHDGLKRFIHNIENAQFRTKFEDDLPRIRGRSGIGVISDFEDQPLFISSHLGVYAIVTVGAIQNLPALAQKAFAKRTTHFSEISGGLRRESESRTSRPTGSPWRRCSSRMSRKSCRPLGFKRCRYLIFS